VQVEVGSPPELHVGPHGLHVGLHEPLLPHESGFSPHGSHLLAQGRFHSLLQVLWQGLDEPQAEKQDVMPCQLPSLGLPSQELPWVEHVGGQHGLHPLPQDVLQPLGAALLDGHTFAAQERTQLAEGSNRSSNDSRAETGRHDPGDC